MVRIAFCDDDLSALQNISKLTERYKSEKECEIEYSVFQSPLELMACIDKGQRWDIIFLDIIMPGENGIDIAGEIRNVDENVKLIFLTSTEEYAVKSYEVNAFYYLLKPISSDKFFSVFDRALAQCEKKHEQKVILKCKTGITAVLPSDIEYCEVIGHNIILHIADGKLMESAGKMDDMEEKLYLYKSFLRVHRSYLVNMDYIQTISYRSVVLRSLTEIPIPRGKYNEIKKRYLDYAFEKEGAML